LQTLNNPVSFDDIMSDEKKQKVVRASMIQGEEPQVFKSQDEYKTALTKRDKRK